MYEHFPINGRWSEPNWTTVYSCDTVPLKHTSHVKGGASAAEHNGGLIGYYPYRLTSHWLAQTIDYRLLCSILSPCFVFLSLLIAWFFVFLQCINFWPQLVSSFFIIDAQHFFNIYSNYLGIGKYCFHYRETEKHLLLRIFVIYIHTSIQYSCMTQFSFMNK